MTSPYRIVAAGESALIVEFEERIDSGINARTIACAEAIQTARLEGVRDVVPTFRSVAVYFDPLHTDGNALAACLERAANGLGSGLRGEPLPEDGPKEVARAATAFNAMQRRIAEQAVERIQILAGISRRLQTPITRMRLRADFLGDSDAREKLQGDLQEMQTLVKQGLALAREYDDIGPPTTAHVAVEASREPS